MSILILIASAHAACTPSGLRVRWVAELESPVYSTPLIFPLSGSRGSDIVVATLDEYIEVISHNGMRRPGWPIVFPGRAFHASPLLNDVDGDGQPELLLASSDGSVVWTRLDAQGKYSSDTDLQLPSFAEVGNSSLLAVRERSGARRAASQSDHRLGLPASAAAVAAARRAADAPVSDGVSGHVVATPAIGDLDGDGSDELVLAVAYYSEVQGEEHAELASVVCFDLAARRWRWHARLRSAQHVYSAVALGDLDGDGALEVALGSADGAVSVLDSSGAARAGFPVAIGRGAIEAPLVLEDVGGDADLELLIATMSGWIVCLSAMGRVRWERDLGSAIAGAPVVGDLAGRGDGALAVVAATRSGAVWALDAATGRPLPEFPVSTGGAIVASPLLTRIPGRRRGGGTSSESVGEGSTASLDIVVASFDGRISVIDGGALLPPPAAAAASGGAAPAGSSSTPSRCVATFDLGERVAAGLLAADLSGRGESLDIVIGTLNGNLVCLSADGSAGDERRGAYEQRAETLPFGGSVRTARASRHGITVRRPAQRDLLGRFVPLDFEVVDARRVHAPPAPRWYNVSVRLVGGGSSGSADDSAPLWNRLLTRSGSHRADVRVGVAHATLLVEMVNEHGQRFADVMTFSSNVHYANALLILVVAPPLLAGLALLLV